MLSILLQLAMVISAHAQSCGFAQTIHGPFHFRQVEMISRVHSVGLWRGGDVALNPWIEISENAYLGLDQEGRAIQILKLQDRTVGILLSGERKLKDLFFHAPGTLLAIDDQGQLLAYEHHAWQRSETREILARSARNFGVSVCAAGTGLWLYSLVSQTPILSFEIGAPFGISALGAFMIEGFRAAVKFEKQNETTDGFKSLGVSVMNYRRSEFVRGETGEIVDYDLGHARGLKALLAPGFVDRAGANFDKTCEHDLLPRGIPPETYEPTPR